MATYLVRLINLKAFSFEEPRTSERYVNCPDLIGEFNSLPCFSSQFREYLPAILDDAGKILAVVSSDGGPGWDDRGCGRPMPMMSVPICYLKHREDPCDEGRRDDD